MQGRKPEEEIQHVAISHVYAKISHSMQNQEEQMQDWVKDNFAHPTKPQDAEKKMNFVWSVKSSYAPPPLDFYLQIFV